MKYILIIITLVLVANYSEAQSVLDYLKIKKIEQIEISFAPDMGIHNPNNKAVKTSKDSSFIDQVFEILRKLPAAGSIYIDFPQSIPCWRIGIFDQDGERHELTFYGIKLRSPDNSKGSFYSGKEIGENEKNLYLAIKSFMIGPWYTCDDQK